MKLIPCPFCGGEASAEVIKYYGEEDDFGVWPGCKTEGCFGQQGSVCYDTEAEAIAAWTRRADGWVSVEDDLPTDDKPPTGDERPYIVSIVWNGVSKTRPAYFDTQAQRFASCEGMFLAGVTHWRPMPEPPEVET